MSDLKTKIYNILVNDQDLLKGLEGKIAEVLAAGIAEKMEANTTVKMAKPLTKPPKRQERFYSAGLADGVVFDWHWDGGDFDHAHLQAGLAFPHTPEGKAGAEHRAKQGIIPHPGASWYNDIEQVIAVRQEIGNSLTDPFEAYVKMASAIDKFLSKYK